MLVNRRTYFHQNRMHFDYKPKCKLVCQTMSNDNGRLKAEIVLHNAAEDVEGQYRAGVAHMGVVVDLASES